MASVAAILLAVVFAGPRAYGTNDNFGVIENARAGIPAPYCAYLTTRVLHGLYAHWPEVPWFAIGLLCAVLAAAAVLAHLACRIHSGRPSRLAACALVVSLFLPLALRLDYNTSSILLGAAAVLLLAFDLPERPSPGRIALVVVLCLWSYCIRRMGFFCAACLLSPIALLGFAGARPRRWLQPALAACIVGALVVGDGVLYRANASEAYGRFVEFNGARKPLHHSPYMESAVVDPRALAATGWSANQYWLFSNWFYLDETIFTVRRVAALRDFVRDEQPAAPSLSTGIAAAWKSYRISYCCLASALLLGVLWKRGRGSLPSSLAAVGFVAGTLLMETYWQFPLHVGLPLLAAASGALIAIPHPRSVPLGARAASGVVALAAVVVLLGISQFATVRTDNRDRARAFSGMMQKIGLLPADSVFLLEGGVIQLEWSDPFHPPSLRQSMIRTGMSIFSPLFYDNLARLGIHRASEVIPFLAECGRGYLIAHGDSVPHLIQFARDDYGLGISAPLVERLESGANIYRIVPNAPKQ